MAECKKGSCTSDLRLLLESGERADMTLVVGEAQLPAHNFILAARSPVFAAMFRSDMLEATSRRIEITGIREAVVRQMLLFIYTDMTPELAGIAAELLVAADKYELPLLKERCEQQMVRDLSVDNAAAAAGVAVLYRCPALRSAAVKFIAGHPEVMATAGWAQLLRDHAGAAIEVCEEVATTTPQPKTATTTPQPKTATKETSTDVQPEVRILSQEIRQKMVTKLINAAWYGRAQEVWALLTAGAPKDTRDVNGNTALHLAVTQGRPSTVRVLLDGGLDVNAVNNKKQTPLHLAAQGSDVKLVWMLVAAAARVDAQDDQGQTPLHVAVQKGNSTGITEAVSALLLAGARKDIKDTTGQTPESIANSSYTKGPFTTYNDLQ